MKTFGSFLFVKRLLFWIKKTNFDFRPKPLKKNDSKYDLIICNPPFYVNSLKANNDKTNLAYHSTSLTQEELLESVLQFIPGQIIEYFN